MAKLTQKDIDNYNKLKAAFDKITNQADVIIVAIKGRINQSPTIKSVEELGEIVNPLYSYWKISSALGQPIKFSEADKDPGKFEQQFSDAIEDLKDSLEVVKSENLDLTEDIKRFRPDSLFFNFIASGDPQTWTKKLIDNIDLNLNEDDTSQLIGAWGTAVNLFSENARQKNEKLPNTSVEVTPFKADTFTRFFRIHKELEILYGRLAETETFQKSR